MADGTNSGNKVRKGFFLYLIIFFVIVIAFFGVCITIMLFNPGKSVLGIKYFSNNETHEVTKAAGDVDLNLGSTEYSEVKINASCANVTIEANSDNIKDCIIIKNKLKGFAKASEGDNFNYSVKVIGNVLNIDVTAKRGFINFSTEADIIVHIAQRENDVTFFKNTVFDITTTTGNVVVGGYKKVGYSNNMAFGGFNITTESGNITFTEHADNVLVMNSLLDVRQPYEYKKDITINTKSGYVDLTHSNTNPNFKVDNPSKLTVNVGSGKLKLGSFNGNMDLFAKKGTIEITSLTGALNASLTSSILNVKEIQGDLDFSNGNEVMDENKIYVDKVTGIVNIPDGRKSEIRVLEVGSMVNIQTTGGNVMIGSEEHPLQSSTYVETTDGKIEAYFNNGTYSRQLKTNKGNIYVKFLGDLTNGDSNRFTTNSGKIAVSFPQNSRIEFNFARFDGGEFNLSKVSFKVLNGLNISSNPFVYNDSSSTIAKMYLTTNKEISLNLN